MANFKKKIKYFFGYAWQMIKAAIPSMFMYICAGLILMMLLFRKKELEWNGSSIAWTAVCVLGAAAYNALIAWAHGGSHYEMLVSGNIKRSTAEMYGSAFKMSSHKEAKEYRVWKGFAIGGVCALLPLLTGLAFGLSFAPSATKFNPGALIGLLCSGWSVLPLYCMNQSGASISYFVSMLFALIPILVSGGFYIAGAYARRNKAVRQQMLADKAAEAEANRVKKINYGGLPGTKPRKKRK
jgi:hypothetical protein